MHATSNRLRLAGVLAGVTYAAGLVGTFSIPGGGDVTDQQFTDFYSTGSGRAMALLLFFCLAAGSWLMAWFFTELVRRLPGSTAEYSRHAAWAGTVASIVGGGLALAPSGVQLNSTSSFVGVPVAHAFDQAGLFVLLVGGLYSYGLALLLGCLAARRAGALARWQSISGAVVGVLLLASYLAAPAFLLPLWVLVVGLTGGGRPAAALVGESLAPVG